MQVRQVMSPIVCSVKMTQSLNSAAHSMNKHDVGAAVVLKGTSLVGIITERDILRAIAERVDFDRATVADFMVTHVVTAAPNWDVSVAAKEMVNGRFRHLVVQEGRRTSGMISVRDLLPIFLDGQGD